MEDAPLFGLWGIDGELAGNHRRLYFSLPFVIDADRVGAARDPYWGLDDILWLSSPEEAEELGTRIDSGLRVRPAEGVAVAGSAWRKSIKAAGLALPIGTWMDVDEGFQVAALTLDCYKGLASAIGRQAIHTFDLLLRRDPDAQDSRLDSLDVVISANTEINQEARYARRIALLDARREVEPLDRLLRTSAVRLGLDATELLTSILGTCCWVSVAGPRRREGRGSRCDTWVLARSDSLTLNRSC